ncbi:MAG: class II glutamine amidotransferase [Thermoprotei archaeon]|nr:class II glutamine amidotransferase [Thermoprotei archaeon]
MCRMIGIISVRPTSLYKYLVEDECSLLIQAEKGKQSDGWGIGYYERGKLRIFKSPRPVYEEKELFINLGQRTVSNIIIAHVRKASNPRNLPKERLISLENTQPFYYENYLFVHNGTIYYPDEVLSVLGEYRSLVKGINDSEVYFALLMKGLEEKGGDFIEAIKFAKEILWKVFNRITKRKHKLPYSSLNTIFSDGKRLYAFSHYLSQSDLKSICYKDSPYFRMVYYYNDKFLVIASEKTNKSDNWKPLEDSNVLIAEVNNDRVEYNIERV